MENKLPAEPEMPVQTEPLYCAEARVVDAVSWLIKAAVQLDAVGARGRSVQIRTIAEEIMKSRKPLSSIGTVVGDDAHIQMIQHALLNAAGHAMYAAQFETSERLIKEAGF